MTPHAGGRQCRSPRRQTQAFEGLEAIVRTDGSRPSFLIREGVVDRESSPIGGWGDLLDTSADGLGDAIACVGRIDVPAPASASRGPGS